MKLTVKFFKSNKTNNKNNFVRASDKNTTEKECYKEILQV